MPKLLTFILIFYIASSSAGQAQLQINTVQEDEYIGITIKQNKDSLSIKTFDDIEVHFDRKNIYSMIQRESRIVCRSGKIYIGHVSEMNDSLLVIVPRNEIEKTIRIDSISIIESYDNSSESETLTYRRSTGRIGKNAVSLDSTRLRSAKTKTVKPNLMLGLTAFSPGGINGVFGIYIKNIGFRFSAGKKDDLKGFQFNLSGNIVKKKYLSSNLSFGIGYITESKTRSSSNWWNGSKNEQYTESTLYFGGFLDITLYAIFAEIGVTASSSGDYRPQFRYQLGIGYIFEASNK